MRVSVSRRLRIGAAVTALSLPVSVGVAQASDTYWFYAPLGPPVPLLGISLGLSGDGTTVVGQRDFREAFYWNQDSGLVGLGFFPGGSYTYAQGANFDGSVIVGGGDTPTSGGQAFRWTQQTGLVGLGFLPGGNTSLALGVNFDGSVVVGRGNTPVIQSQAFRWTPSTGMVGLPIPDNSVGCGAVAVSADGNGIVGSCSVIGQGVEHAWYWRAGPNAVSMGIPFLATPGPGLLSTATAISADGRIVVGADNTTSNLAAQAFKWTVGEAQSKTLPLLPGGSGSQANAINADGSVIVGAANDGVNGNAAVRWTDSDGIRRVADLLSENGVSLGGWLLASATGVSADGSIICGNGFLGGPVQAWCSKIGTGFISNDVLSESLASTQAVGEIAFQDLADELRAVMDVARHFRASADVGTTTLWGNAVGDEFDTGFVDRDAVFGLAGLSHQANEDWRIGAGVRFGEHRDDLAAFDGALEVRSWGANAFAAFEPSDSGLRGYIAGIANRGEYTVARGYLNGVEATASEGECHGSTFGASVAVGWMLGDKNGLSLMPFVGYSAQRVELEEYTETSGPFPAHFDALEGTLQIARLGAEARLPIGSRVALWTSAGWGHRFEDQLPDVSGEVLLLSSSFLLPGAMVSQDWAEGSAGFGWNVDDGISVHAGLGVSSDGHTVPNAHANLGIQIQL